MLHVRINNIPVIMSKFFSATDRGAVLDAIPEGTSRVVFIDTPATSHLVETLKCLVYRGITMVFVRDHHDVPNPRNPREQEINAAANRVRELVGSNATISDRVTHPACSSLVEVGEFADQAEAAGHGQCGQCDRYCPDAPHTHIDRATTVIVADPDPDGLTAAMKACGLVYDGLDADAAVLDGPRSEQTAERLTPLALLLVKGLATLPPFDAARPKISDDGKSKLFQEFVAAASGNKAAFDGLSRKVEVYEASVRVAEAIAATATQPVTGVVMVDAVGKPRHDLATLSAKMESTPGCRITVVRKDNGPIAAKHGGVQISLAVAKASQAEVNLQELLNPGFTSSPESGIISNTTFLLHVSQEVWDTQVLPALRKRFA